MFEDQNSSLPLKTSSTFGEGKRIVHFGDRIRLYAQSPYCDKTIPGGFVGTNRKADNLHGILTVLFPLYKADSSDIFYRLSQFTVCEPGIVSDGPVSSKQPEKASLSQDVQGPRQPLHYQQALVLVDEHGLTWNNKVGGLTGYIGPRKRSTAGELHIVFSAPGKSKADPVSLGDEVSVDVLKSNRKTPGFNKRLMAFKRKDHVGMMGGYITCDGKGLALTFSIHAEAAVLPFHDPLPTLADTLPANPAATNSPPVSPALRPLEPPTPRDRTPLTPTLTPTLNPTPTPTPRLVGPACAEKAPGGPSGSSSSSSSASPLLERQRAREQRAAGIVGVGGGGMGGRAAGGEGSCMSKLVKGRGVKAASLVYVVCAALLAWLGTGSAVAAGCSLLAAAPLLAVLWSRQPPVLPTPPASLASPRCPLAAPTPPALSLAESSQLPPTSTPPAAGAPLDRPALPTDSQPRAAKDAGSSALAAAGSESGSNGSGVSGVRSAGADKTFVPGRDAADRGPSHVIPDWPRWLEAGEGDEKEGVSRFELTHTWRQALGLERILTQPHCRYHVFKRHTTAYCHKTDKMGHPVWIERPRDMDLAALRAQGLPDEALMAHYLYVFETLWATLAPAPRGQAKGLTVLDLTGIGLADLRSEGMAFFRRMMGVTKQHYPCRAFKIIVVNPPWGFSGIYGALKATLPARTVNKISIVSGEADVKAELLSLIAPENLPREYGGSCQCGAGPGQGCSTHSPQELAIVQQVAQASLEAAASVKAAVRGVLTGGVKGSGARGPHLLEARAITCAEVVLEYVGDDFMSADHFARLEKLAQQV